MKKFTVLSFLLAGAMLFGQDKYEPINKDYMDMTVRLQDDFYNFVNGNWMENTEIPSDRARWGSVDELRENTDLEMLQILEKLLGMDYAKGGDKQKIDELYKPASDFDAKEKGGIKPIEPH